MVHMTFKAVNDTLGPYGLVLIFIFWMLIFLLLSIYHFQLLNNNELILQPKQ